MDCEQTKKSDEKGHGKEAIDSTTGNEFEFVITVSEYDNAESVELEYGDLTTENDDGFTAGLTVPIEEIVHKLRDSPDLKNDENGNIRMGPEECEIVDDSEPDENDEIASRSITDYSRLSSRNELDSRSIVKISIRDGRQTITGGIVKALFAPPVTCSKPDTETAANTVVGTSDVVCPQLSTSAESIEVPPLTLVDGQSMSADAQAPKPSTAPPRINMPLMSDKKLKCGLCFEELLTAKCMMAHMGNVHPDSSGETSSNSDGLDLDVRQEFQAAHVTAPETTSVKPRCIIQHLITNAFTSKSRSEQYEILQAGQPRPDISALRTVEYINGQPFVHLFHPENYKKLPWLTGSTESVKLYCWPCVLFSFEKHPWNTSGYRNVKHLPVGANAHEQRKSHLFSCVQLKLFEKSLEESRAKSPESEIMFRNDYVRKIREIYKHFIDTVYFATINNLRLYTVPYPGDKMLLAVQLEQEFARGSYLGVLNLLSTYDVALNRPLEYSNSQLQKDIICSIRALVFRTIKSEVDKAAFVSIMLYETSDSVKSSCVSTFLRFVDSKTGRTKERFIGFGSVSVTRSLGHLVHHVEEIVERFNIEDKFVAQSCDGSVVHSFNLSAYRCNMEKKFVKSVFIYNGNHELQQVLIQSICGIQECHTFFQTIAGFHSFLHKTPDRIPHLLAFIRNKSNSVLKEWCFEMRFLHTLLENKEEIVKYYQNMLSGPQNWEPESIVMAQAIIPFLTSFQTKFLLLVFNRIFTHVNEFHKILKTRSCDVPDCIYHLNILHQGIGICKNDFENIWVRCHMADAGLPPEKKICFDRAQYLRVFNKIFTEIAIQLRERFMSIKKLEFSSLVDSKKFSVYKITFPENSLQVLQDAYVDAFDVMRLKNELMVLYNCTEFNDLSLEELVKRCIEKDMHTVLPQAFKLMNLVLTLPSTADANQEFADSIGNRLNCYKELRRATNTTNLEMLIIEKKIMMDLKKSEMFYNDVITEYNKREKRLDLSFKS